MLPIGSGGFMDELKRLRVLKGWSQEQLAEKAGVSRSAVQDAERGEEIRVSTAKKLAAVFGIDWRDLFNDAAPEEKQTSA